MTVKNYTKICLQFAQDTQNWGDLVDGNWYSTDGIGGWTETSDNGHGGLYVDWAFHRSPEYIKENAAQELLNLLVEMVELGIDEEWDENQFEEALYNFK